MEKCSVIIVAAGSSRRAGFDKLMAPLSGEPVLAHSVRAFASSGVVNEVILVTNVERFGALHFLKDELNLSLRRVDGGCERHLSVVAGLASLAPDVHWVAIHDGARPLISKTQILRCFNAAIENGAAASAHPVVETLKRREADGYSGEAVNRNELWAMETPQIFHRSLIEEAYEKVLMENLLVTDEVSALEHIGYKTMLVENGSPNPKITRPGDLHVAEALINCQ